MVDSRVCCWLGRLEGGLVDCFELYRGELAECALVLAAAPTVSSCAEGGEGEGINFQDKDRHEDPGLAHIQQGTRNGVRSKLVGNEKRRSNVVGNEKSRSQ